MIMTILNYGLIVFSMCRVLQVRVSENFMRNDGETELAKALVFKDILESFNVCRLFDCLL